MVGAVGPPIQPFIQHVARRAGAARYQFAKGLRPRPDTDRLVKVASGRALLSQYWRAAAQFRELAQVDKVPQRENVDRGELPRHSGALPAQYPLTLLKIPQTFQPSPQQEANHTPAHL